MFGIMLFVILSHFTDKARKLNIGVNIRAGHAPDNAGGGLMKSPYTFPQPLDHRQERKTVIPDS